MVRTRTEFIETNGITLHVASAGPADGPLVILLHGFPEFWYGWRYQIEPLAEAGYRVMVPDQRGYNLSDKPAGAEKYKINKLRDDIIGLIDRESRKQAVIIGHDWGGAVGWHLASTRPEYVEKFIPINMPHPAVVPDVIRRYPLQGVLSSYIPFFQLPALPEKLFQANQFSLLQQAFYRTSKQGTFSKSDIQLYKQAWSQPGALTSMLNWYRALRKGSFRQVSHQPVTVPVRMIWGRGDQFLSIKLAKESLHLCEDGNLAVIDGATHWVTLEQPELVNTLIARFLTEA